VVNKRLTGDGGFVGFRGVLQAHLFIYELRRTAYNLDLQVVEIVAKNWVRFANGVYVLYLPPYVILDISRTALSRRAAARDSYRSSF
jgi:hypothetical protein